MKLTEIEVVEPVVIGGSDDQKQIVRITVEPLNFAQFVDVWSQSPLDPTRPEVSLQNRRILWQSKFYGDDEKPVTATVDDLHRLPIQTARKIINSLNANQGKMGEVVGGGEPSTMGHSIYKLGTPLSGGKTGGKAIRIAEIEFSAKTYGEIEDVLAADNDLAQTVALIRKIGNPVGAPIPVMTNGLVQQITMADGIGIMRTVLPNF